MVSPGGELAQVEFWRYAQALEGVIANGPTLSGKAMDSIVVGHAYHEKEEGKFMRKALLMIDVMERSSASSY